MNDLSLYLYHRLRFW